MVRNMAGHGCFKTRNPPPPACTGSPSRVTTSAITPGNGRVAEPGVVAVAPGSGVIMIIPVSVCHHVSTMGQRLWPMCSRYHICLLYTSDAADEEDSVDLGGRRI